MNVREVVMFLAVFWVVTSGSVLEIIDVAEESAVSIIREDDGKLTAKMVLLPQ
jgi:hypothetical protein